MELATNIDIELLEHAGSSSISDGGKRIMNDIGMGTDKTGGRYVLQGWKSKTH